MSRTTKEEMVKYAWLFLRENSQYRQLWEKTKLSPEEEEKAIALRNKGDSFALRKFYERLSKLTPEDNTLLVKWGLETLTADPYKDPEEVHNPYDMYTWVLTKSSTSGIALINDPISPEKYLDLRNQGKVLVEIDLRYPSWLLLARFKYFISTFVKELRLKQKRKIVPYENIYQAYQLKKAGKTRNVIAKRLNISTRGVNRYIKTAERLINDPLSIFRRYN